MSKAFKIIRGEGSITQYNSHQTLKQERNVVLHYLGSDGEKYRNSYGYKQDSEGNRITYTVVRQGLGYLKDACVEWLENQRLDENERKSSRWNIWNLSHQLRTVRAPEYLRLLRSALASEHGLIMGSSVLNPYTDGHIKLYRITDDTGSLWLKSWRRRAMVKKDDAREILNFFDTNKVLFDGVMAKIETLEAQRQGEQDKSRLAEQRQMLDDARTQLATVEAELNKRQAEWEAQQAWLASAPEHMKFRFHAHYSFKRDYANGMHDKSPEDRLEGLKRRVKSYAESVDLYQAKVDQHELLHGGEEE